MYFIAYNNGRKLCDGYAGERKAWMDKIDRGLSFESQLGDEQKWSNVQTGNVVYMRPSK